MFQQNNRHSSISSEDMIEIIDAWRKMIMRYLVNGWDAYLVSILFHEIGGSTNTKILQMSKEIERIYNRLATRMVRNTWSPAHAVNLPKGIFLPDLPVPKRRSGKKSTIEDVSINEGLHMGGILLANKRGRIRDNLENHFEQEKEVYKTGKIRSIGIRQITHDVEKPVNYTFKSLTRRRCTPDDVLVLNWAESAKLSPALRILKEAQDYVKTARGARIREAVQAKLSKERISTPQPSNEDSESPHGAR
jgi:hypothetical protein